MTGASSWNKLYDRYYRKLEMYKMQWEEVDLAKMKVCGAPFSGPVALLRDSSKISMVSASTVRNTLNIYSSAGGYVLCTCTYTHAHAHKCIAHIHV